jgi:uracil-DNA glycosylase
MTELARSRIPSAVYDPHCTACPRLAAFLQGVRAKHPDYWARPVPSFGAQRPKLLIVGLAPGMHGANRTGRPFTGDYAGILLYQSLHAAGLASAAVSHSAEDPLRLLNARIVNTVKCLPPANKPLPQEIACCNRFLAAEIAQLLQVRAFFALGRIAHEALLRALGLKRSGYVFAHGAAHELPDGRWLVDSYHCSRYNTQTRRLTAEMFRDALARACERAGLSGAAVAARDR